MSFSPRPYDLQETTPEAGLYHDDPAPSTAASFDHQTRLMTPPVSGRQVTSGDESGDVFLRLAKEDAPTRSANGSTPDGTYSPVSATHRSWHRRPLSTTVASYQPLSPPKLRRRLSDHQQERPPSGNPPDERNQTSPSLPYQYQSLGRDKAASAHPGETANQLASSARAHRPPPLSSRSPIYHDNADSYRHTRRRSSVTDSTPPISGRGHSYKTGAVYNYSKTYNSSPLVRNFELPPPQPQQAQNGMESPESTASTTAPSTVWDELDELKSRINRLEIRGKTPSTSGAAVAKLCDERPATANTQLTGVSSSPKRYVNADQVAAPTQRESHVILQDALAKCRGNLGPQVFGALDCLAQDAMALSTSMGYGPVSSGTSTIGTGSTVTDRQLRRKAEGLCRSLTELCIALNGDADCRAANGAPSTPTLPGSGGGSSLAVSRRASIAEGSMLLAQNSPRPMSRLEERRHSLLYGSGPPVSLHSTPGDAGLNRHSPLLVSRTRQTRQEGLEDGRASSLLHSRGGMTDGADDGRQSAYMVRTRRGTGDETMQPLIRSPTRRVMDQYEGSIETPERQETSSIVSSGGSRRRMASDVHGLRLAAMPMSSSPAPTRRYMERSVSTREEASTPTLERISRRVSVQGRVDGQPRSRDSMIPRLPTGNMTLEGLPR